MENKAVADARLPAPPTLKATLVRLTVAMVFIIGLIVFTVFYSTGAFLPEKKPTVKGKDAPRAASASSGAASASTADSPAASGGGGGGGLPSHFVAVAAPQPTSVLMTSPEALSGSRFTFNPLDPFTPPAVEIVELPVTRQGYAIWGSLGTDSAGRIYAGVSTDGRGGTSGQLMVYEPESKRASSGGLVLDQLKYHGLYQHGMGQAKIHTRIIQGADGYLYFASMDEQGEAVDGSLDPWWGGYLWRWRPGDENWQPLFHSPKALVAVAGYNTDVYALGYFGHVLYHFDTRTGRHQQMTVGSMQGHLTRNFLVDQLGQAYVPRLKPGLRPGDPPQVSLVQFDRRLQEVGSTPLEHYIVSKLRDSHGIISFVRMRDGSIIFATHHGYLYRIAPARVAGRFNPVEPIGFFHPRGAHYTPTMHTFDGRRYLVGVVKKPWSAKLRNQAAFEWVVYDLQRSRSTAVDLDIRLPDASARNLLLYGSMTRDKQGHFYVVGTHLNKRLPLLVKLSPKMN